MSTLPATEASFYDTSPLIETLRGLVDFDLINDGNVRLTLGATDVESGEVVYFDSAHPEKTGPIGPEHVLASGSLPPGFPAVQIQGRYYWDGGCVSNSPAEAVVQDQPAGQTLIFMIDLWDAAGTAPTTMDEVLWRAKQIQYASRGHLLADAVAMKANLRQAERRVAAMEAGQDAEHENQRTLDVMHIIYHPGPSIIAYSDAEFSRSSIRLRREAGYRDMVELLEKRPWHSDSALEAKAAVPKGGAVLHRVKAGRVFSHAAPGTGRVGEPKHRPPHRG
jgi:NTE family protein